MAFVRDSLVRHHIEGATIAPKNRAAMKVSHTLEQRVI
jgi:hypothetical protein